MKQITYTIGTEKRWNGKPIFADVARTWKRQACTSVAKVYGAYTTWDTSGGWPDADGNLIEERGFIVTAVDLKGYDDLVAINLGAHLRDRFGQTCVPPTIQNMDAD